MDTVTTFASTWNLLDNLSQGVVILQGDGQIAYMNLAATELLGLNGEARTLAQVYQAIAPHEMWQHLLAAPSEAYLHTAAGPLHIEARPYAGGDAELVQLLITPREQGGADEEPGAAGRHLQALARVSEQLNSTLGLENILLAVVDEAIHATGASGCQISLYDEAESTFRPHLKPGRMPPEGLAALARQVSAGHQSLIFNNLPAGEDDIRAALIAPIVHEGRVAGLVQVYSDRPHRFKDEDRTFVAALAHHAAIALGNTRRFDELERRNTLVHQRAQQIERFVESSRVFHGDRPLDEVYEDLVYAVQEGVGFGVVVLSLVEDDDARQNLRRVAAAGLPLQRFAELRRVSQPWSAVEQLLQPQFALARAYFIAADRAAAYPGLQTGVAADLGAGLAEGDQAWREGDLFIFPLRNSRGQPLGLISLDAPNDGRRPDLNSATALEVFANQAATAIENVGLLHNTRKDAARLQQLHNVTQQVLREFDFDQQLRLIVDGLQAAGWRRVSLTLRDNQLNPTRVVVAGLSEEEAQLRSDNMPPPAVWRERLSGENLERRRIGLCYFVPEEDAGMKENRSPELPNRTTDGDEPDGWRANDLLFLPLYDRQQQVLAIIGLDDPVSGRRPTARDLQVIELYAQFATSVVETARLYQETQRQLVDLQMVNRVSQAISTILQPERVMEVIGQSLMTAYQVNSYYIALYRPDDDVIIFPRMVDDGERVEAEPIKPTRGPTTAILHGGRPLLISREEDWSILNFEVYGRLSLSYLGVPMRIGDRAIGVLAIQHYQKEHAFSPRDIDTLTIIASQAAVAIENAQLVTELRDLNEMLDERVAERTRALGEERDRVEVLLRITSELAASLDQDRVLSRALELVNEFVNATQGGILLIDPETGQLIYRAAFGAPIHVPPRGFAINLRRNEGLAGWIIQHREAVIITDTHQDDRWVQRPDSPDHRSVLAVPLISSEEVMGVLMLFHSEPNAFSEQQLELVKAAATQVSSAVNNAQLYLLIRDQAERLGTMLREEQIEAAKYQTILESIADGVLVAAANGEIILANQPGSYILDMPRSQLVGKTVRELLGLYGSSGDSWVRTIQDWARHPDRIRERSYLADQLLIEDKVVSVHLSPVFASHQFFGTVSIFRDVTQEVEVDRMKSEFVSTVSHELRTPMTSIKGYADLMLMGAAGSMTDPQQHYLRVIKSNADRLSMLVNDLLDISRIETGKTELMRRPLDVSEVVEQVVDGHLRGRIEHENKLIHVSTDVAPALPLVYADYARVTQILTNLLDNAFHYTPEQGSIRVMARANGDYVRISVSDTGIGIGEENIQKIFDRFFRAEDELVQRVPGTGLGLSIVRSLVEMHGGQLEVESAVGQGSTFTFTLPLVIEDGDDT